jgi:hypothetical protein
MKKFATIGLIPLFAGFLWAQEASRTTTTTTTTWNGTLVDWACQSSHTESKESSTQTNPDQSVTHKESSRSTTVSCPVTTTTTSFGLLTSDGRYVHFDEPSNTKIVEVVKSNKDWNRFIVAKKPVKVKVVGTANGEVVVLESIQ